MKIGYARGSTTGQKVEAQIAELKEYGCERIFSDKVTGSKFERPGLNELYLHLRPGDEFVVVHLDRVGRGLVGAIEVIEKIRAKGVNVISLSQSLNFETPHGMFIIQITLAFAELEKSLINQRIRRGVKLALEKGVRFGRKPGETKRNVREVAESYADFRRSGMAHSEAQRMLAKEYELSVTALHRYLDQEEKFLRKVGFVRPKRKTFRCPLTVQFSTIFYGTRDWAVCNHSSMPLAA